MRAIGVTEFGGPEALRVVEIPDRAPAAGEVAIRVHAAAVNPTDTVLRSGARAEQLREVEPPHVPGMDAAGIVDELGEDVAGFQLGQHVMAVVVPRGTHGAYSERIVVPAESVAPAPEGADDAAAATLPMNGLTARMALDLLGLGEGELLAVTGAAGAFGGYAVQLGKLAGLHVIADAAEPDEQLVRDLGADEIVARGDDVAERIRSAHPDGVHGVADGAVLNELIAPAVRSGGRVATVRGYSGQTEDGVSFHPTQVAQYAREQAKLAELGRLAGQGSLTLRVARTLPAEQAPEAHRILQAGGTRGRVVLQFSR